MVKIFFDKDLEFIQPIFPPSKDVVDILYFIAVFSNPIFSIWLFTSRMVFLSSELFFNDISISANSYS